MPHEQKAVEFKDVSYSVSDALILDGLDMSVEPGEILILLGESGCGKTTTLKLINRLIEPTSGEVLVNGTTTTSLDAIALRREIGYVMQESGLFPHFTVNENVGLKLMLAGAKGAETASRTAEMLELVGLDPAKFGGRFPHELSGGQRQRVGVARALASDPRLLLLDEPFGALDALTRADLQREFAELVRKLNKTAVFVTHDLQEAMRLGDRIVLMQKGKIVFNGPPADFLASTVPLAKAYAETIELAHP